MTRLGIKGVLEGLRQRKRANRDAGESKPWEVLIIYLGCSVLKLGSFGFLVTARPKYQHSASPVYFYKLRTLSKPLWTILVNGSVFYAHILLI